MRNMFRKNPGNRENGVHGGVRKREV